MSGREQESVLFNLLQIAAGAVGSFIFFFFIFPNQPGKGGAVSVFVIGGITATRACWDRRHYAWFWLTLAAVFVVQGGMIIFLPWSKARFPGIMLLPIGLADYALVYGLIKLVEKFQIRASQRPIL
jgi:hypothetical protein